MVNASIERDPATHCKRTFTFTRKDLAFEARYADPIWSNIIGEEPCFIIMVGRVRCAHVTYIRGNSELIVEACKKKILSEFHRKKSYLLLLSI